MGLGCKLDYVRALASLPYFVLLPVKLYLIKHCAWNKPTICAVLSSEFKVLTIKWEVSSFHLAEMFPLSCPSFAVISSFSVVHCLCLLDVASPMHKAANLAGRDLPEYLGDLPGICKSVLTKTSKTLHMWAVSVLTFQWATNIFLKSKHVFSHCWGVEVWGVCLKGALRCLACCLPGLSGFENV